MKVSDFLKDLQDEIEERIKKETSLDSGFIIVLNVTGEELIFTIIVLGTNDTLNLKFEKNLLEIEEAEEGLRESFIQTITERVRALDK